MQMCNGICPRYKASMSGRSAGQSIYAIGIYRCQVCRIYITPNGVLFKGEIGSITCRCCHNKVRTKPRAKKMKAKYMVTQERVNG